MQHHHDINSFIDSNRVSKISNYTLLQIDVPTIQVSERTLPPSHGYQAKKTIVYFFCRNKFNRPHWWSRENKCLQYRGGTRWNHLTKCGLIPDCQWRVILVNELRNELSYVLYRNIFQEVSYRSVTECSPNCPSRSCEHSVWWAETEIQTTDKILPQIHSQHSRH